MSKTKSAGSIRRTHVENLNRAELWRELARFARELGQSEAARRGGMPRSTLQDWINRRRVPERAVERAQDVVRRLREEKAEDQELQVRAAFWASAAGPDAIPLPRERLVRLATAVKQGQDVRKSDEYAGTLDELHDRVLGIYTAFEGSDSNAATQGGLFWRELGDSTWEGRQVLALAFLDELGWITGIQVVFSLEGFEIVGNRPNAEQTTFEPANVQSCWNYTKDLPHDYFVWLATPDAKRTEHFVLSLWEIKPRYGRSA
jgi:hypothetical protein